MWYYPIVISKSYFNLRLITNPTFNASILYLFIYKKKWYLRTESVKGLDVMSKHYDHFVKNKKKFLLKKNQEFSSIRQSYLNGANISSSHRLLFHYIANLKSYIANTLFLYPLETSEKLWFSHVFRGYIKGALAWNELTHFQPMFHLYTPSLVENGLLYLPSFRNRRQYLRPFVLFHV